MEAIILIVYLLVFAVVALVLQALIASIMSSVVLTKGYTMKETHAFAKCFWLGLAGWLYVIALPNRNAIAKKEYALLEKVHRELYECKTLLAAQQKKD